MKEKRRKIPFVLLELLIGFALVNISIFPFLRFPYLAMKKEIEFLYQMELTKKLQMELVNLQTDVMSHKIKKHILFEEKKEKWTEENPSWTIEKKKYDLVKTVKCKKQKKGKNALYSLIELKVQVFPPKKRGKTQIMSAETYMIAEKNNETSS